VNDAPAAGHLLIQRSSAGLRTMAHATQPCFHKPMTARASLYDKALERASTHAREWLASVPERPVGPRKSADQMAALLARPLPEQPSDPAEIIDELAELADPGLGSWAAPSRRRSPPTGW